MKLDDIVKGEIDTLIKTLEGQVTDPAERIAIAAMVNDLALLPVRMAQGQNVEMIMASIQAEAALRGSSFTMRAQLAVQQAWLNIVGKLIGAAISGIVVA